MTFEQLKYRVTTAWYALKGKPTWQGSANVVAQVAEEMIGTGAWTPRQTPSLDSVEVQMERVTSRLSSIEAEITQIRIALIQYAEDRIAAERERR